MGPWRAVEVFLAPILGAMMTLRIRHGDRLPREGAYILTPNHFSDVDPVVMGFASWKLTRVPRYLAKASLFRVPVLGGFLRALGQIPVERAGGGTNPLTAARELLDAGHAVIIYPEGTLTRDPDLWPMRGKSGAVRAALEFEVPLIPAAHWGTQQLMPRWSKKLKPIPRKTIDIAIGEPFDLAPWRGKPVTAELLAEATDALMAEIAALVGELRGETPPAERWDPSAHGQSEFGRP